MMVIELRKAHQDKVYELLDDIRELAHKKKTLFCELEDILHECFESSEEEYEDDEYEDDKEMAYRGRRQYRSGMRDMHHDHDDYDMDLRYRRGMRRGRRTA